MFNYTPAIIAPVFYILLLIYLKYKFPKGDFSLFYLSFFVGIAAIGFILLVDWIIRLTGLGELHNLRRSVFYTFVMVGGAAELSKFLIVMFLNVPDKRFKTVSDGIVYSLAAGLGLTSAFVIYSYYMRPISPDLHLYMVTLTPMAIALAIIMGFFLGMGKVRNNLFIDAMTGLFAASFFHGLYRFCILTQDNRLLIITIAGTIIISMILLVKAVQTRPESQ
jgi:RsiW-degrading membrane proteinase PrsW (M82 family)